MPFTALIRQSLISVLNQTRTEWFSIVADGIVVGYFEGWPAEGKQGYRRPTLYMIKYYGVYSDASFSRRDTV